MAQYLCVLLSSRHLKTDLDGCAVIHIESTSEARPLFCLPLNFRASLEFAQLHKTSICPLVTRQIWTGQHQDDLGLVLQSGGKADGREEKLLEPTLQTSPLSYFCTELKGRTKTGRGRALLWGSVSDLKPSCCVEAACRCREVRVWFQPQDPACHPLQLPRHILSRSQKKV